MKNILQYYLDKKISELKKILWNEEIEVDTEYDYVDRKNLNAKLEKIRQLVSEEKLSVNVILVNKDIWKTLYNILWNDLMEKYKRQKRVNLAVRFMYSFLILFFVGFTWYFLVNPPTDETINELVEEDRDYKDVEMDQLSRLFLKKLSEDEENVEQFESFLEQEEIQEKISSLEE